MIRLSQEQISCTTQRAMRAVIWAVLLVPGCMVTASEQPLAGPSTQSFHVLYAFTGGTDGGLPNAGLLRDSAGNLYGTTYQGGDLHNTACNCGVVFQVSKTGVETVLYTFTGDPDFGGPDGGFPLGVLTSDQAGNIYGTTAEGGNPFFGVVFKIDTKDTYSVLHTFGQRDGSFPLGLVSDGAGNLYGVTVQSDEGGCCGAIYRVDSTGQEEVLHFFKGSDGSDPYGDLAVDAMGDLYGTAEFGGTSGHYGVVFRLNATGKVKVLHSFTGGADGAFPLAGVVLDASGNVYGTASAGGQSNSGVVFKMDQTGALTVLYSFTGGTDGGQPRGGLARDSAGNLYGTTTAGGDLACNSGAQQPGCGVVFRLDPAGRERVLHRFTGGADGAGPGFEKLVLDDKGNLYGTTTGGGVHGYGVVFAITH